MAPVISNIQIVQQVPYKLPNASLLITFDFGGGPADLVEIYVGQVSGELGVRIASVDLTKTEFQYASDIIEVQAGQSFYFYLCPRTTTDNVLDNTIDGEYWEHFCVIHPFTTRAPSVSPPVANTTPVITELTPETATLRRAGGIVVQWTAGTQYEKWHLMWKNKAAQDALEFWSSAELTSASAFGFGYRAAPFSSGITYSFKVQGCKVYDIGADDCSDFSPTADAVMQNTHSLLAWLDGAPLRPGILSLGQALWGRGFRAMLGL